MKREISLADMHNIQLGMMKAIHQFCIEKNIRYSLGGGTLLGAVRHKGFIPWDDDVDIMMPRPDYERFLTLFEGIFPQYNIQHYKNDNNYYKPFAKVYDNRTLLIEAYCTTGVFIDVFPIDGMPNEDVYILMLRKLNKLARRLRYTTNIISGNFKFLKRLYGKLHSRDKALYRYDKYITSYKFETSEYAGAISGAYGVKEHMPVYVFDEYVELKFEDTKFMAIKEYDLYLKKHYGDYMQLPPIENRISHEFKAYYL